MGVVLLIILCLATYIVISSGYFRTINKHFEGKIATKIEIPGAEDIQISHEDDFALFISDDRASRRDGDTIQGHLYYAALDSLPRFTPKKLTANFEQPFFPHGFSMLKIDSSTYRIFVINHIYKPTLTAHTIEVFDLLYQDSLVHRQTLQHESMVSPNDVVAISKTEFYFTNDHGYTSALGVLAEEYLGLAVSNVVYYNGDSYTTVADGIAYANGINIDRKRNLLLVASPRSFGIHVYNIMPENILNFVETIKCGTGVDNIEIAANGSYWVGCHPSLLHFAAYAKGKKKMAPSEIIRIDYQSTNNYQIESVLVDNGELISGTSVAAPYQQYILAGSVMDTHLLVLRTDGSNY